MTTSPNLSECPTSKLRQYCYGKDAMTEHASTVEFNRKISHFWQLMVVQFDELVSEENVSSPKSLTWFELPGTNGTYEVALAKAKAPSGGKIVRALVSEC